LGNTLLILMRQPDYQVRLRADPGLVPRFVEESLRLESPVQGLYRRATRDTLLDGVKIPAGSMLNMRYGAANRDEIVYSHATDVDLDRKGIRNHLAFGSGIHYCAGSILARLEVTTAVQRILSRMRNIRLDPPEFEVRYVEKLAVRSPVALPIAFDVVA
jgi:cytochrome P450